MSDKLPEWPEKPSVWEHTDWPHYTHLLAEAALARMEALVKHARHMDECQMNQRGGFRCTCGLSELLAACERRKS